MITKSDLYDTLYAEGTRVLQKANPCNIRMEGGRMLCNGDLESCCHGCMHLGPNGCTVEALSCKFWLCDALAQNPHNASVVIALETLRNVGYALGLQTHPYSAGFRKSKAQHFAMNA